VNRAVLDASAIMAAIHREPGAEKADKIVESGAAVSAVNLAEVVRKFSAGGALVADTRDILGALGLEIVPFDTEQAYMAGALEPQFDALGLSLGDRACLTLAKILHLPAVTTDRQWAKLRVGVDIVVLR